MADDEVIKVCRNPNCTGKNPVKGEWCTASACKDMCAMATAAKKQSKLAKAWPSIPGDRVELMVISLLDSELSSALPRDVSTVPFWVRARPRRVEPRRA